jgi:1-acyl-sn-glycerol-3-phosphate acyltransferase
MPQAPLQDPPGRINHAATALKISPVLLFMMSSLLGLNMAQTLSTVMIPFSKKTFRSFNRWAANTWWGWCVQVAEKMYGTKIEVSGDQVPEAENAIVIANHQQMPDITFLMFFARDKKRLGDLKWFVKDIIKYVPGVGWGMVFLDCVFVKRNWAQDQDSIENTFSKFLKEDIPIWLISFVEGTRFTPKKLKKSQKFAEKRGIEFPKHVLLPRTKGFVASVVGLRNHIDAVYDVTIGYEKGVPTLWQYIKGLSRKAHLNVQRFPIEDLPKSEDALSDWLTNRYREKDRLLERFYQQGSFV